MKPGCGAPGSFGSPRRTIRGALTKSGQTPTALRSLGLMNVIVSSAFVAIGALFCVVVLRRHPEHVVALNTDSMEKRPFRVHGFVFGLVRRLGRLAAHVRILA